MTRPSYQFADLHLDMTCGRLRRGEQVAAAQTADLASKQDMLAAARTAGEAAQTKRHAVERELWKARHACTEAAERQTELRATLTRVTARLHEQARAMERVERDAAARGAEAEGLRHQLRAAQSDAAMTREQADRAEAEGSDLRARLDAVRREDSARRQEVASLTADLAHAKAQARDAQREAAALASKVSAYEAQVSTLGCVCVGVGVVVVVVVVMHLFVPGPRGPVCDTMVVVCALDAAGCCGMLDPECWVLNAG